MSAWPVTMGRMQTPAAQERTPPGSEPRSQAPVDTPDADRPLPAGLRAFSHRDYRVFWFTQLFSLTGTWVQSLAQSWLVLTLTDSPAACDRRQESRPAPGDGMSRFPAECAHARPVSAFGPLSQAKQTPCRLDLNVMLVAPPSG